MKNVSINVNNNNVLLPAVVRKLDDVVRVTKLLSVRHHLEERTINVFPVHHQVALEEPMAAVLAELSKQKKKDKNCFTSRILIQARQPKRHRSCGNAVTIVQVQPFWIFYHQFDFHQAPEITFQLHQDLLGLDTKIKSRGIIFKRCFVKLH